MLVAVALLPWRLLRLLLLLLVLVQPSLGSCTNSYSQIEHIPQSAGMSSTD
jgi:hypothetical protein